MNTPRFDGADYDHHRDAPRLTGQLARIWDALKGGHWLSLGDLSALTSDPQASISAQLRHLRKERFGAWNIEKRYMGNGLYHYRLNGRIAHPETPELAIQDEIT